MAAIDYAGIGAAMAAVTADQIAGSMTEAAAGAALAEILASLVPANSIGGLTSEIQDLIARIDGTIIGDGPPADDVGYIGAVYIDKVGFALYGPKDLSGWGDPVPTIGSPGQNARHSVAIWAQYDLGPNEELVAYEAVDAVTYSAASSRGNAGTPATATAVITILNNGEPWGTVTFAPGATDPVFSIPNPSQAAGDVLTVRAPVIPDASLANVNITLAGA